MKHAEFLLFLLLTFFISLPSLFVMAIVNRYFVEEIKRTLTTKIVVFFASIFIPYALSYAFLLFQEVSRTDYPDRPHCGMGDAMMSFVFLFTPPFWCIMQQLAIFYYLHNREKENEY